MINQSKKKYRLRFRRRLAVLVCLLMATIAHKAVAQMQNASSSSDYKSWYSEDIDGEEAAGTPQYDQSSGYPGDQSRWSHVAFEAGGGFTAPTSIGGDFVTWGYNLTLGAGWNFTSKFGALFEYQFNRNKIPGATLAAVGAPGGNVNTWSLTVDPISVNLSANKWVAQECRRAWGP